MRIAIVVPVFNGAAVLPRFFHTLLRTTDPVTVRVIAVDNGSSDRSISIIEELCPSAVIVRNAENRGFAPACNQGIRLAIHAGCEAVMLANQDLSFDKQWLDPLICALKQESTLGAVQPLIMLYPETDLINSCGNALHYLGFGFTNCYRMPLSDRCPRTLTEVAYCSGAALMLSVPALKKVGVLDDQYFMYHEESDLCWRMRIAGYTVKIEPSSRVFHEYVFAGNTPHKFKLIERNRISNLLKNYEVKTLVLIAPVFLLWELGLFVYSICGALTGTKTISVSEKLRAYGHFFRIASWRSIADWRKKIARFRIVHDRDIVNLFTDTIAFQDVVNPLLEKIANPVTRAYWQLVKRWI